MSAELTPSEEIILGWKKISEMAVTLSLPQGCSTDADCPEGYVCKDGVCIPMGGAGFPVGWLLLGGSAVAAAFLILTRKKSTPKEKKK
jgi:Cys-rich repeat protein